MRAKALDFGELSDAQDYLVSHGFYQFTERTYQHRFNGKTAHITAGPSGDARVTII